MSGPIEVERPTHADFIQIFSRSLRRRPGLSTPVMVHHDRTLIDCPYDTGKELVKRIYDITFCAQADRFKHALSDTEEFLRASRPTETPTIGDIVYLPDAEHYGLVLQRGEALILKTERPPTADIMRLEELLAQGWQVRTWRDVDHERPGGWTGPRTPEISGRGIKGNYRGKDVRWLQGLMGQEQTGVADRELLEAIVDWQVDYLALNVTITMVTPVVWSGLLLYARETVDEPLDGERILCYRTPYMRGNDVKLLQWRLVSNGISPGRVNGVYGPKTRRAVMIFQRLNGLRPSGIVDQETRRRLGM